MRFYSSDEVMEKLKAMVKQTNQRQVAAETGFAFQYINDVLHGRRELSEKLALAIGYKRLADRYERVSK